MAKYIHTTETHNTRAAEQVIPILFSLLDKKPTSVVDVGCGLGTWLKVFNQLGVANIRGYEGSHLDLTQVVIPPQSIVIQDLEKPFHSEERFDLALSLEVAEHLSTEAADVFIQSLVQLSDVVLFSAAIPGQGGQNHINEQDPNYWRQKFDIHGYDCFDLLREKIWSNPAVDYWYSQNCVLYAKRGVLPFTPTTTLNRYIHPVLFDQRTKERNRLAQVSGYVIWEKIKKMIRKNRPA